MLMIITIVFTFLEPVRTEDLTNRVVPISMRVRSIDSNESWAQSRFSAVSLDVAVASPLAHLMLTRRKLIKRLRALSCRSAQLSSGAEEYRSGDRRASAIRHSLRLVCLTYQWRHRHAQLQRLRQQQYPNWRCSVTSADGRPAVQCGVGCDTTLQEAIECIARSS